MSREEYEDNKALWSTSSTSSISKDHVTIQLAIVGPKMCIAFVDKNKLMQITCVPIYPTTFYPTTSAFTNTWYDPSLAPCPIMDFPAFQRNLFLSQHQESLQHKRRTNPIYFEIAESKKNHLWNGIGTSHAVEILHRASIHPEEKTNSIFQSEKKRDGLLQAIRDFFAQVFILL